MPKLLVITVDFEDDTDYDFLRVGCIGAVESVVDEFLADDRNDGAVEVSWDVDDVEPV